MTTLNTSAGSAAESLEIPNVRLPEFVLGQAPARGDKTALIEAGAGRSISYAQLAAAVHRTAQWLTVAGVRPGDVVGLCATGSIEFVIAWHAALSAGAVMTTLNPVATDADIADQFARTRTRWLITSNALLAGKLMPTVRRAEGLAETFVFGPAADIALPLDAAAAASPAPSVRWFDPVGFESRQDTGDGARGTGSRLRGQLVPADLDPDDVAWLAPSSGTAGRPKIVVLTHRNLVSSLDLQARVQGITERDVTLALTPMFHVYGQAMVSSALKRGATVVILPRFEFGAFLRAIQIYRVTRADIVPPVAVLLAKSELVDEYDVSSLRLLTSAAAPLSLDIARACSRRLDARVVQAFGMTEAGGGTHFGLDDGPDKPDSVGPALPGVRCRVIDPDTGKDRKPGEPGELIVRTPGMMRGYLDDPATTAATIDSDGWLHTGDIVTVDAKGWYRVTDRIKESIKYKGHQVAPAEHEDVLLAHPAVAGRVSPHKRVRRVEFVDAIPKSAAGKILRRQVVDREYRTATEHYDLTGMVVFVSGGGRGIGRLLSIELTGRGAAVGLLARSVPELSATVDEITRVGGTAIAVSADVTDRASLMAGVAELTERLGQPDVLVNNAGVSGPVGPLWEVEPEDWNRTFDVNVNGAFALTRIVLPHMIARGQGRIINITSRAAVYRWPLVSAYAASKAALVRLSETLAAETSPHGVAVFSFDPGLLPIGMAEAAMAESAPPESARGQVSAWLRDRIASGHGADPAQSIRQLVRLVTGVADPLSGRHLTGADDLDAALANIDQVERDELYYLRLRTARD